MILSFSKESFKEQILSNIKNHTIRVDRKERWKKGQKIHFWLGNPRNTRSKLKPHEFHKGTCSGVQKIEMSWNDDLSIEKVLVDNRPLDSNEIDYLSRNDGFESPKNMIEWFNEFVEGKSFKGRLIHWTKQRY